MARIEKKEGKTSIALNEEEARQLIGIEGELEFFSPKKGLVLLSEKTVEKHVLPPMPVPKAAAPAVVEAVAPKTNPVDEKLFKILQDRKQLSNRIVDKFEKTLSPPELKRFQELLKDGVVEKFKLSEQYKKPVYRLNEKKWREYKDASSKPTVPAAMPNPGTVAPRPNSDSPAFFLDRDGYAILRNDDEARRVSYERQEEFKGGLLRGIKSFDGSFFVIKQKMLEAIQAKILSFLEKQQKADLQAISKAVQWNPEAVRAACEFLKEDGQIFEKTRHMYCMV